MTAGELCAFIIVTLENPRGKVLLPFQILDLARPELFLYMAFTCPTKPSALSKGRTEDAASDAKSHLYYLYNLVTFAPFRPRPAIKPF